MAAKKTTTNTTSSKPTKAANRATVRNKKDPDNPAMTLLQELRLHGGLDYLCDFIRSCKLLKMSDADLVHELKKRYNLFLDKMTEDDLKAWIRRDIDVEKAYFSAYESIGGRAMNKIYERLADDSKADNDFLLTVADKFGAVEDKNNSPESGTAQTLASILSGLRR